MDAMRKQLDVLMGANRNGDVREVNRKYYDRDVCRLYLVGLCPHELFQLTKMDMGPCPKVHSLQLRKEYEESRAKGVDNYEVELENVIDKLIVECDKKIGRALKRLEDDDAKAAIAISVTENAEVIEMSKLIKEKLKEVDKHDLEGKTDFKIQALEELEKLRTERAEKQSALLLEAFNKDRASLPQPMLPPPPLAPMPLPTPDPRTQEMINEKLKKAEDLGEQGMVDEAQKALEEAEALKKLPARQEPAADSSKYTAADVRIESLRCNFSECAFLSLRFIFSPFYSGNVGEFRHSAVYSHDRRLADHFGGKLHLGYMQIREKLTELQLTGVCGVFKWRHLQLGIAAPLLKSVAFPIWENKHRKGDRHDDQRSKEQSRDRDREPSRDRDRGDSRDRGREYDRKSRDRDRYNDRDRGYDRERDRGAMIGTEIVLLSSWVWENVFVA
ncbi:hypothetical protein SADUNF_Sadunf19G0063900 [Salix dunnii]|uniref:RNA-binding protein Luc7-like 2 n=1 Tax=Salix dunnii TaxID=1413687 RepID=A0A835J229_9ROSI|nr:hypothetical protein SADUNF_Sadunf19G0063900 [Salix dunnii]